MRGITEVGGTLMTANGGAVLGHVSLVRIGGIPGTFECQSEVPVEKGATYALGLDGYALIVCVEDCWIDVARRRYANGRVLRQLADVPGISRPHEEGCPLRGWREQPGVSVPECECIGGTASTVRE